jgi:osmotically-inducible protein OsmY
MTTATPKGRDVRVRNAVLRQLDWDPEMNDSAVGVTARDGVVTLIGFVNTCAGKLAAERIAKRIRGVRAVANDLIVRLSVDRTDADIAADAVRALRLRDGIPEQVQTAIHNGYVTLTGTVEWTLQKEHAADVVRHIRGVRGVANHIDVAPRATQRDVRRRIVQALHRRADVDARHIQVAVENDVVELTGAVRSWSERDAAEAAARRAPGIRRVDNQIFVVPREPFHGADAIC